MGKNQYEKTFIFSHSSVLAAIARYLILTALNRERKTNFCSEWVIMIQEKADEKAKWKHYVLGCLVKISLFVFSLLIQILLLTSIRIFQNQSVRQPASTWKTESFSA